MDGVEPVVEPKHETPTPEPEPTPTPKKKRKNLEKPRDRDELEPPSKWRKIRGALLASNKPSYCLKQGIGSSLQCGGESLHSQHRKNLWRIFNKLMLRHNWAEASGVLSVLLQATAKDKSFSANRAKYTAALELLKHIKGESLSSRRIQGVYELWMKKLGPLKKCPAKDRFAVQREFIRSCLKHGSSKDAHQAALCLMQERGFDSDPDSNLVVGLTYYQLWYSALPKELQLRGRDSSGMPIESEIPSDGIHIPTHIPVDYSKADDAHEAREANSHSRCDSETSIANDKQILKVDVNQQKESMDTDIKIKSETSSPSFQPQDSYVGSAEESEHSDYSLRNYSSDLPHASIFYTKGLPLWVLPLKLPSSVENLEDVIYAHRKLLDNHYKTALKHLRIALYSSPPALKALHPFIQMLLLGDQVHEALDELENLFPGSETVLQLRLKASLLEHFDGGDYVKLYMCFEDILKKDPTCRDSLAKLILMHKCGDYDTQKLVEMIALHLDATYGTRETWNEFASCILKLSQCEEDRMSTCDGRYDGECLDRSNKIPELFTRGESGASWRSRARRWLERHFNNKILVSEIASGDLKLLTYKAATASHIYGRHFQYVVKATECIEKKDDMELYSLLQTHLLNSIGFYSV